MCRDKNLIVLFVYFLRARPCERCSLSWGGVGSWEEVGLYDDDAVVTAAPPGGGGATLRLLDRPHN